MGDTREVHDPFLNKAVQVSNKLTDRLRGLYANGPTMPNGEPEFGWREFPVPPIQKEAAAEIERLEKLFAELLPPLREVLRISDRKHDAWDQVKAVIAMAEGH